MRAILGTIVVAVLLGGGGAYLWLYYGGFSGEKEGAVAFINLFSEYADTADEVERLVHTPGTEGNTDRQELLALLNSMLTENMDATRRESLARIAFTNLDAIKRDIDAAQAAQARLYGMLQDLDNAARTFSGIELRGRAEEIVATARKRAEISARITSILSETNDHTYSIITRILADKGELTQEHITLINDTTRMAEERFDTLSGLYSELVVKKDEMDRLLKMFVADAL